MQYLLAAVAAVAIAVLLWRLFAAERVGVPGEQRRQPPRPVAPDDDPDFLRKLGEQQRKKPEDEG